MTQFLSAQDSDQQTLTGWEAELDNSETKVKDQSYDYLMMGMQRGEDGLFVHPREIVDEIETARKNNLDVTLLGDRIYKGMGFKDELVEEESETEDEEGQLLREMRDKSITDQITETMSEQIVRNPFEAFERLSMRVVLENVRQRRLAQNMRMDEEDDRDE